MAGLTMTGLNVAGLSMNRLAAPTAAFLVRILEGEAGFQLAVDIVHFRADQEHRRFRIDQDGDTLGFDHLIELALLVRILERIGQPRATAGLDADADPYGWLVTLVQQRSDPLRRPIADIQRL